MNKKIAVEDRSGDDVLQRFVHHFIKEHVLPGMGVHVESDDQLIVTPSVIPVYRIACAGGCGRSKLTLQPPLPGVAPICPNCAKPRMLH